MLRRRPFGARGPLMRLLPLLLACLALIAAAPGLRAETRIALVVGNGGYAAGPLPNAVADARLISGALADAGFAVQTALDVDHRGFKTAVRRFADALRAAGPDAVAAFYYAGHGVQVNGRNFLIPVNTPLRSAADVEFETVDAQWILDMIGETGAPLSIIMLDACRNNPFPSVSRAVSSGLARMDAPRGAILSYATAPGGVALDGRDGNSPYAKALSRAILTPGLKVEEAFKRVRRSVLAETDDRQTPWESSSLLGDFYFSGGVGGAPAPAPAAYASAPASSASSSGPCPDCPDVARVAAGRFGLGSPASEPDREAHEGPEVQVSLPAFELAKTEVTVGQWKRFLAESGYRQKRGCWHWWGVWLWDGGRSWDNHDWAVGDGHPVTCVSWDDAQAYIGWLNARSGGGWRLPSEAELEWAAGGDAGPPWGREAAQACRHGNFHDAASVAKVGGAVPAFPCEDGWVGTAPVGEFRANGKGVFDVLGNAWEWTADCWNGDHALNPRNGAPAARGDCARRVMKGGHMFQARGWVRPAHRYGALAKDGNIYGGFRLARDR